MKQMAKRILAFLLVLGLAVPAGTMAPLQTDAYAAPTEETAFLSETETETLTVAETTIYVDGSMSDYTDHDGSSAALALQDLKAAVTALGTEGGTVVVSGATGFGTATAEENRLPAHEGVVVITAKDATADYAATISLDNDIVLGGPTVFENICISTRGANRDGDMIFISASGNKLVLGEGITTQMNNGYMLNVTGVERNATYTGNTDVTIKSGIYSNVYGAAYQGNMTGNTSVLMTGGTIKGTITGGSFRSKVTGNTSLTFDAAQKDDITIKGNIYGSTIKGITDGDAYLTLRGNTVVATVLYGGGRDASYNSVTSKTTGTIYIDMSGNATVNNRLYGGGNSSQVNDVYLTMRGNARLADSGNVSYLGANNAVTGDLTAIFSENASTATDLFSGSRLNSNKTLTTASTTVILKDNATIGGHLRGGGNNGTITGSTYIGLFDNSKVAKSVYGSNYNSGETKGKITIVIDGGSVGQILSGGTSEGYSGTASGGADIILKSGSVAGEFASNGVAEGLQKVYIDLSAGGALSLSGGTPVETLTGGGTLTLGNGEQIAVAGEVTGTTKLIIDGIPENGVYVTAPTGTSESAISYTPTGVETMNFSDNDGAAWEITGSIEREVKVVFTRPDDVEFSLYSNVTSGNENGQGYILDETSLITPDEDGNYTLTENGFYLTVAKGDGYYHVAKPFWLSDAKKLEAQQNGGIYYVDADPGKVTGDGDNQANPARNGGSSGASPLQWTRDAQVVMVNEEVLKTGFSTEELKSYPEGGYPTPAFTKAAEKGKHEYSSNEDLAELIEQLDAADADDIMHHYIAGYSEQYNFPMHVLTFSQTAEIPEDATLEEAAAIIVADAEQYSKPVIFVGSQVHGNEISAGEGGMAYVTELMGEYGEEVLKFVNVVSMPRLNPDGAYKVHRLSTAHNVDFNRDMMALQLHENVVAVGVFNMFKPHLLIDLHENQANYINSTGINGIDIWVGGATMTANGTLTSWIEEYEKDIISEINADGLDGMPYPSYTNTLLRTSYHGLAGTIPMLFEVRGNGIGKDYYDRRVHAHVMGCKSAVPSTAEEAATLLKVVEDWRAETIEQGGIYDDADPIVLELSQSGNNTAEFYRPLFQWDGTEVARTKSYTYYDTVDRSRVRPTGYFIEKSVADAVGPDENSHTSIKEIFDNHGVEYFEIPAGTTIEGIRQAYASSTSGSKVTEQAYRDAADVTFETGAYFFPMDQVKQGVIAYLLEQDFIPNSTSSSRGTLYQRGYLTLDSSNNLPIYHYTQDDPRALLKQFEPEESVAAEFGGTEYETLAAAITAAETAGGTVKLLNDVSEDSVAFSASGVTVDLNGKTLTCGYVMNFGGNYLVDSSADNSGKLVCEKGSAMFDAANPDLVIWNGTDGYFFAEMEQMLTASDTSVAGKFKLTFLPKFTQIAKIAPMLADNGGADHGVTIKVKLLWEGGSKELTYSEDMVKTVYGGNAFTVTLSGYEAFLELDLQMQVVVETNGVVYTSDAITVE